MPDGSSLPEIKISQLPVGTSANLTDMVEVSQTDPGPVLVSRSVTVAQVATAVVGTLPAPPTIPTTLPPSGPAGGDLQGLYPNPQIKPGATNGQVLTTVSGVAAWAAAAGGGGGPPTGAAGGALNGTYPNPGLVGGPLSNYALTSSIPTTLPPSGVAGGDLAGTYPNPTLKPSATNGQVMTTVGGVSAWATPTGGGGSGTVTSTSVVSANGLAGTVATPTTTPAITLNTTITGMLKGNGTAISAATAGTDYMTPANVSAAYLPTAGGSMAASAAIGWTGKSQISSPADGNFLLANNAGTGFTYLQFGGTTSAFPALFRNGNQLSVLLADGSAFATLNANNFNVQNGLFYGTFGSISSPGVDGQFEFFNNAGTAATRLDIATDGTIKFRNRTNAADAIATFATQPTTQNDNSGATTAFVKAAITAGAGKLLQTVSFGTGAVATGSTIIPFDDTIPQQTEGDQYMSLAITPQSATSKLIIEVVCLISNVTVGTCGIAALFQDSTANALAAMVMDAANANYRTPLVFRHTMTSGTTSSTTFKVRAGANIAGQTTFNGQQANRLMGGVMASSIVIREVLP